MVVIKVHQCVVVIMWFRSLFVMQEDSVEFPLFLIKIRLVAMVTLKENTSA